MFLVSSLQKTCSLSLLVPRACHFYAQDSQEHNASHPEKTSDELL